ncbi:MAG: hypothetical protein R3Y63_13420 [Eubacteriales bacterium]
MEMTTITLPAVLTQRVEKELEETGQTWAEFIESILGKEASPSVDKALREAYASGTCEKTYHSMEEIWVEIDSEDDV